MLVLLLRGGIVQSVPSTETIYGLLWVPICMLIIPVSSTRFFWQYTAETPGSEAGESWREINAIFADEVSF
jgi:hypothetical protein